MLDQINLNQFLIKEEYNAAMKPLEKKLSELQQRIKREKIPVIMVFEGWGAAGKGSLIAELILNFDPRGFKVTSYRASTKEEQRKPILARYWVNVPEDGNIALFDRSWYREVNVDRIDNELPPERVEKLYEEINIFDVS